MDHPKAKITPPKNWVSPMKRSEIFTSNMKHNWNKKLITYKIELMNNREK